jgi:hypothetical protein
MLFLEKYTSKDEIKLGDGYLKYMMMGCFETCFCDDLRFIGDGDLKVVATNDDFLIKMESIDLMIIFRMV